MKRRVEVSGLRQEDFDDCKSFSEKTTYLTGRISGMELTVALENLICTADEEIAELKATNERLKEALRDIDSITYNDSYRQVARDCLNAAARGLHREKRN